MKIFLQTFEAEKVACLFMFFMIIFSTSLLFIIGWSQHHGFLTSIIDMGHYDQAIWGIIKEGFLLNTSQFNIRINKLGFHFDPILYAFSPFYFFKPTVNWLIFAQALSLSISAWPIFQLAKHFSKSELAGVFWGLAYLVNPFLLNAATWDFHPLSLAVPFVALAALATEKKRFYMLLLSCSFIMLCMEHFGLMVAGFGLLWGIRHREVIRSLMLVCLGGFHFFLVFNYVMPAFSPTGGHVMMSSGLRQLSRYSWLGNSFSQIVQTLFHHPLQVVKQSLISAGGLDYLFLLLLPFLGLPVLGGSFLLPSIGDLAANLLSTNPMPRNFFSYHSAAVIPLFCVAAIKGSSIILRWKNFLSPAQLAGIICVVSIITGYVLTALPLPLSHNFWAKNNFLTFKDQQLNEINKIIDPSASISVQANIGPHFSQRKEIYAFPNKVGDVDMIVLRLKSPTTRIIPHDVATTPTLASLLQIEPNEYLNHVELLLDNNQYGVFYWQDPWLIFKKGQEDKTSLDFVRNKIYALRKSWHYSDSAVRQSPNI